MTPTYFSEAIKVLDGQFHNLSFHQKRLDKTLLSFSSKSFIDLSKIEVPSQYKKGLVKCRILYSLTDFHVEFNPYTRKVINSLKLIHCNTIDYTFKYADRQPISELLSHKENCDDILIVKNGYITDTSFSNVVFENESGLFTPSTYLLRGTKREYLLQKGIIKSTEIKPEDIKYYSKLYMINAMVDIEDNLSIKTSNII
ncbi:MAG: aminotransferase class IV [Dysgonomonas sp.]|nr:aminotransferase class IV [Dysgonomonas sp.]